MTRLKRTVSLALDIAAEQLNEISLEDVEIEDAFKDRIYEALYAMAMFGDRHPGLPPGEPITPGVPCTGFWVEDTRELVLFAWLRDQTKAIVIPPEQWFLRPDITRH